MPEPFLSWFHTAYALVRENDEKALFLLLLVEEMGVPLPAPGDIVIMLAGYRVFSGEMSVLEAVLAVVIGVQLGSTILYTFSRKVGHGLLFRYGRLIHLDESKLKKIEHWIHQRGPVMVLVGRLTPGLRTPTSIMSGVFEIPFAQFLFFASLSALIWSFFWLGLGYFFGRGLLPMVRQYHHLSLPIIAAITVLLAAVLLHHRWRSRRETLSTPAVAQLQAGAPVSSAGTLGPDQA